MRSSGRWTQIALAVACLIVVSSETYLLFGKKHGAFQIQGRSPDRIQEFADGTPVSQAFRMLGNGLTAVEVKLVSNAAVTARVRWTLSRGSVDYPPMTVVATDESSVALLADHPQLLSIPTTRDGSSHDRWYTVELRLEQPLAGEGRRPEVAVMASSDNPDRGGVLWIGNRRQPGSLMMKAQWESSTVYRRFVAEGVPHLPRPLRHPVVQFLLAAALHLAFAEHVFSLLRAARPGSAPGR